MNSPTIGMVNASLDTDAMTLTLAGMMTNITSTAAHIHGPAAAGMSAGVLITLAGFSNTVYNVTPTVMAHLLSGKTYVNVHTAGAWKAK